MTSPQNGQTMTERFNETEHVFCSLVILRSRGTRVAAFDFKCTSDIPEIENTTKEIPRSQLNELAN